MSHSEPTKICRKTVKFHLLAICAEQAHCDKPAV